MRSLIDVIATLVDPEAPANVIATARVGTRVLRCIGAVGFHSQIEVANQLDSFLEHIRQQKVEEERRRPRDVLDVDVEGHLRWLETGKGVPWPAR
jgi:hypothetical protein